jgi:hypothetical protein
LEKNAPLVLFPLFSFSFKNENQGYMSGWIDYDPEEGSPKFNDNGRASFVRTAKLPCVGLEIFIHARGSAMRVVGNGMTGEETTLKKLTGAVE